MSALLILSFSTQAPYGDLTRIGALAEGHFGWREPQPAIEPRLLTSSAIDQADILVVGDSFSIDAGLPPRAGLVWQSRLVANGWRVASLHWDRTHPLCPDFNDWLASTGFHGRWVLLESVERALDDRLQPDQRCSTPTRPTPRAFTLPPPATQPPVATWNLHEQLLTGIATAWNTRQALQTQHPAVFKDPAASDKIRLQPYAEGCRHFSHAACDRALFLLDDELKPAFDHRHLPLVAATTRHRQPWHTAWLIVPNKRSYYLRAASFAPVSAALQSQGLGPDVLAALQAPGAEHRDLYFPNDTHLSPRGALLLGDAVAQWLSQQPH